MFKDSYNLLGAELQCHVLTRSSAFSLESDVYDFLKKITTSGGYKYLRIDTTAQMGFPDILILKGSIYCMIEAKRLNKKRLVSLEDDLKWQFGQIGFAVRSAMLNLDYVLAVGKDNKMALIGQEQTLCRLKRNLNY